jgi:hypothetical protein
MKKKKKTAPLSCVHSKSGVMPLSFSLLFVVPAVPCHPHHCNGYRSFGISQINKVESFYFLRLEVL